MSQLSGDKESSETLAELLVEQFGETVPFYETDPSSVQILEICLKNHLKLKKAKAQLIENLKRELFELQHDNISMELQAAAVAPGSPADVLAACAAELCLTFPTASRVLQEAFCLESEILEAHETLCRLEKQKIDFLQVQSQNQEITDFTERVLETSDSYHEVMNQVESLIMRLKTQISKLDVEEIQLRKASGLQSLEKELNKFKEE